MPSTPKSSVALAMSDTRLQRRATRSDMISIVNGWASSPMRVLTTATLSSTGRDGSVRARSSWMLWSSALVIVNSSFPMRHASSPLSRSLGASESRETRSAIRDASPRIGHLPFLKVSITSCRCPDRRSSGRSSSTARRRFPACCPGSCRPVPLPARRPHPSGSPEPAAAGIRWNAGRWR